MHRLLAVSLLCLLLSVAGTSQEIPAGTVVPIMANTGLNSQKNKPGDRVAGKLMQDVFLTSGEKLRAGAMVEGNVVEVSPAGASARARMVVRFNRFVAGKQQFAINVSLRAVASMEDVFAAQLPWSTFDDYGTSSSDWNTVQVGGAAVYRGDGTVRAAMEVIGHTTDYGAVTAKLLPAPRRGCPANPEESEREQSLWIFSPWACGTYGFEDLSINHNGDTVPLGTIELTSARTVNIRAGSGWLLVIVPTPGAVTTPASN